MGSPAVLLNTRMSIIHWHKKHSEEMTAGDVLADSVAIFMGSWNFIIIQSIIVIVWMAVNVIGFLDHWDAYPFILLNLVFSTQAAYAAPIIMMSQNRQAMRDRHQADADFECNLNAKVEIEDLQKALTRIEIEKLDRIIEILQKTGKTK